MKTKAIAIATIGALFMLSSCAPKILYTESIGFVDYSSYLSKGIFLTESNSVSFEYDAIGSVTVSVFSGNTVISQTQQVDKNDIYGEKTRISNKMGWRAASPESALEAAVSQAVSKGANGLINIKISPATEVYSSKTVRSGYLVTGMAIKRK